MASTDDTQRRLLTQEEYDAITTLAQAKAALRRFVKRSPGPAPQGPAPLTPTERQRRWREGKRRSADDEK